MYIHISPNNDCPPAKVYTDWTKHGNKIIHRNKNRKKEPLYQSRVRNHMPASHRTTWRPRICTKGSRDNAWVKKWPRKRKKGKETAILTREKGYGITMPLASLNVFIPGSWSTIDIETDSRSPPKLTDWSVSWRIDPKYCFCEQWKNFSPTYWQTTFSDVNTRSLVFPKTVLQTKACRVETLQAFLGSKYYF